MLTVNAFRIELVPSRYQELLIFDHRHLNHVSFYCFRRLKINNIISVKYNNKINMNIVLLLIYSKNKNGIELCDI